MECWNRFCIYWSKYRFTLDSISLDQQGTCKECIHVKISENDLDKARKSTLVYYENEYMTDINPAE